MDKGENLRLSTEVKKRIQQEAKELGMSAKAYTEHAVLFFASRKLNPRDVKEGDTSKLLTHFAKGIDRVLGYLVTQERNILHQMFTELVNTRIVCEILLANLQKLSDLTPEEEQKLQAYNNQYLKQRKESIMSHYGKKPAPEK
ncbi:MAG: hypothetical protein ICV83_21415 [Cytophagales bacterium]|nr:hypothetical protein [Cytophagales bacterium]